MSAEVTLALTGLTVVVLVLFTVAAFRYVPSVLSEDEEDEEVEESSNAGSDRLNRAGPG
jgi:Na+-transporting methylmalonyl-CoA/oxaloacetate decarboxylase gamma subunit